MIKNGYEYKTLAIAKTVSHIQTKPIAHSVIGEEILVYYFEPVQKIGHKIWLTKLGRRFVVAKRTISHQSVPQVFTLISVMMYLDAFQEWISEIEIM